MSDVECLVLGFLSQGYHYGHEIEKLYKQRNMHLWLKVTRASIYQALDRIEKKGWARMTLEKSGNFPQRKVYTLTGAGQQAFQEMIREGLGADELLEFKLSMYFSFMDALPTDDVIVQLNKRRQQRLALLAAIPEVIPEEIQFPDDPKSFVRRHNVALVRGYYQLELQWLESLMADIAQRMEKGGAIHDQNQR